MHLSSSSRFPTHNLSSSREQRTQNPNNNTKYSFVLSSLLKIPPTMSTRRSRTRAPAVTTRISDDQIADLVSKLQQLIPEIRSRRHSDKASASKVLQETCAYIMNLQREVGDLSGRLSELLERTDEDSAQAAIIRSLLM